MNMTLNNTGNHRPEEGIAVTSSSIHNVTDRSADVGPVHVSSSQTPHMETHVVQNISTHTSIRDAATVPVEKEQQHTAPHTDTDQTDRPYTTTRPTRESKLLQKFTGFSNLTFESPPTVVPIRTITSQPVNRNPIALPIISYYGRDDAEADAEDERSEEETDNLEIVAPKVASTHSASEIPANSTSDLPVTIEQQRITVANRHNHISFIAQETIAQQDRTDANILPVVTTTPLSNQNHSEPSKVVDVHVPVTGRPPPSHAHNVTSAVTSGTTTTSAPIRSDAAKSSSQLKITTTAAPTRAENAETVGGADLLSQGTTNGGHPATTTSTQNTTSTKMTSPKPATTTSTKVSSTQHAATSMSSTDRSGVRPTPSPPPSPAPGTRGEASESPPGHTSGIVNKNIKNVTSAKPLTSATVGKTRLLNITTLPPGELHSITSYKSGNLSVTTAGFSVKEGSSDMVSILVPALIGGLAIVVGFLIVVIIAKRKCSIFSKYKKAVDDEETNSVLEEKVYLELIYAKVDLNKKSKYRYNSGDEEATPLTFEDSSNNNNSFVNNERTTNKRPEHTDNNSAINQSDTGANNTEIIYGNALFDKIYENNGGSQPPVPTRKTPGASPKTPPSRSHGRNSNKSSPGGDSSRGRSPGASKRSPKRFTNDRNKSSSPERTPKSRRSSPSPKNLKKLRGPPSPKISAGVCWQANESEEETYHNARGALVPPPVDYKGDAQHSALSAGTFTAAAAVACTSKCNGSCGGACGVSAPAIPMKQLSVSPTRKELPPEPDVSIVVHTSNGDRDNYSVVAMPYGSPPPAPGDFRFMGSLQGARSSGLSHSYDPVYVPRSDANAMSRRLDKAGYVTSKLQRVIARGGTEMDILTSIPHNRPIPTVVIGAPIMMRRSTPSTSSDRSAGGDASLAGTSGAADSALHHVYSTVDGARDSTSSAEPEFTENVYATVQDDAVYAASPSLGTRDDSAPVYDTVQDDAGHAETARDNLGADTRAEHGMENGDGEESSTGERCYTHGTDDFYFSSTLERATAPDSPDSADTSFLYTDNPYETVLFRN